MKIWIQIACFVLIIFPVAMFADETDRAKEIIDEAIKAHFPKAETQKNTKNLERIDQGVYYGPKGKIKATRKMFARWPADYRWTADMEIDDQKGQTTIFLKNAQGWQKFDQKPPVELSIDELSWIQGNVYVYQLITLAPLKEAGYQFALQKEEKGSNVIKISRRGKPDVFLYFDTQTHFLVKAKYAGREASGNVEKEFVFSEVKQFGDVKMPSIEKEYIDKKMVAEWKIEKFAFPESLADTVFERK